MKTVIVDFDNSFTLEGHDIDDIIALLYLLSCEHITVPFVCTTFGNSTVANVNRCTENFFHRAGIDLPIFSGNELMLHSDKNEGIESAKTNKAAAAMIAYIERHPNNVELLALGSLRNFADAFLCAPQTMQKIKGFTAMGGTTAPLIFNKTEMAELNFSIDAAASELVLKNFPHPNIITGNNCIEHCYTIDDFDSCPKTKIMSMLREPIIRWLQFFEKKFHFSGNVLWDLIAAMYVADPDRFINTTDTFELSFEQVKSGQLIQASSATRLNLPRLKSNENFYPEVFQKISMVCENSLKL